jgi:hypothetical protein
MGKYITLSRYLGQIFNCIYKRGKWRGAIRKRGKYLNCPYTDHLTLTFQAQPLILHPAFHGINARDRESWRREPWKLRHFPKKKRTQPGDPSTPSIRKSKQRLNCSGPPKPSRSPLVVWWCPLPLRLRSIDLNPSPARGSGVSEMRPNIITEVRFLFLVPIVEWGFRRLTLEVWIWGAFTSSLRKWFSIPSVRQERSV